MPDEFSTRLLNGLAEVSAASWNSLAGDSNPFIQHEYLYGLEKHDCLDEHGWQAQHLAIYSDSILVGAMPLYLRSNSHGEFVFDWAWADAYEQSGGKYYPKLVSAIPFAPVMGPRLLVREDAPSKDRIKMLLVKQLRQLTDSNQLSSSHCLFTEEADQAFFQNSGFMQRLTCQFHWQNDAYRDFDDFLDRLSSKKRKQIKRERRQVTESGIEIEVMTGARISEMHWQVYYQFYCSTFLRRWGNPRLTLAFFKMLGSVMPDKTLLILAKDGNEYVAGAFAMLSNDTLYGRHWGCNELFPFLHFELCYYQTIDYAIKHGLRTVDAGVQGEHKLARGFQPVAARSWHSIRHPGFRQAIQDYLHRETAELTTHLESLRERLPFKQVQNDQTG